MIRREISLDELIRELSVDPDVIHARPCGERHISAWDGKWLWVYMLEQVDVDDWDEYGVQMTVAEYDDLMARFAGIDASAPEEVPE